jgi:enamine deaminase RidA (YjgF/YER057c/UK114 family)
VGRCQPGGCGGGKLKELSALDGGHGRTSCIEEPAIQYTTPAGEILLTNSAQREDKLAIQRFDTGSRLSKVVVHGDTVYLAGLTADKTAGQSVGAQTEEILAAIDALLAKAGTDKSKLVQATIWLQDIRTVDEMNKVWDVWMPQGCAPARACIEARLQSPAKMVEIRVTAVK